MARIWTGALGGWLVGWVREAGGVAGSPVEVSVFRWYRFAQPPATSRHPYEMRVFGGGGKPVLAYARLEAMSSDSRLGNGWQGNEGAAAVWKWV